MTILTQEKVFVNYRNVVSIVPYQLEGETEDNQTETVYVLSATTVPEKEGQKREENYDEMDDGTIPLGVYSSEARLKKVIEELGSWLNERNTYNCLFTMPLDDEIKLEE